MCGGNFENALQPGSAFQSSLERLNGKPSAAIRMTPLPAPHDKDNHVARTQDQKLNGHERRSEQSTLAFQAWIRASLAASVSELDWVANDGMIFSARLAGEDCISAPMEWSRCCPRIE
jgi:hypothetical protein